jgi:hypothetical protein
MWRRLSASKVGLQRLHDVAQRHLLGGREIGVRRAEHDVHIGLGQVVERRLEFGDLGPLGALERIEIGPARAEEAIRRDQRLDVDLLARDGEVGAAGTLAERIGLGALRERLDDGRVRHVAGIAAVDGGDVLQGVEVGAPVVGHRAGIVEISLVHLLDIGGIAAEQVRVRPVLLHHLSLTFRPGFQGSDGVFTPSAARLDRLADCDPPC